MVPRVGGRCGRARILFRRCEIVGNPNGYDNELDDQWKSGPVEISVQQPDLTLRC